MILYSCLPSELPKCFTIFTIEKWEDNRKVFVVEINVFASMGFLKIIIGVSLPSELPECVAIFTVEKWEDNRNVLLVEINVFLR